MSYRRYYITPTRLLRNPFLWRSIGLMTTLKPNQEIFLGEAAIRWLRHNWPTISAENTALCLERCEYHLELDWKVNISIAEKVLDLLMQSKNKDKRRIAIASKFTKEETITKFLEGEFTTLCAELKEAVPSATSWGRIPSAMQVDDYVLNLLSNPSFKMYQLEYVWRTVPTQIEVAHRILSRPSLKAIPDYILKVLLDSAGELESKYNYGLNLYHLMKEGLRRGMLTRTEPAVITVESQPRPTTFVRPIVVPDVVPV